LEIRLKALYELQKIDSKIDDIEDLRGNLPETISSLKERILEAEAKANDLDELIKATLSRRNEIDDEIALLKTKAEKSKTQLYSVKNNKEYDALMNGIDHAELKMLELSEEMDRLADIQKKLRENFEDADKIVKALKDELEEKNLELEEILKSTETEQLELNHQKDKALVKTDKKDLAIYNKIRTHKKMAIAPLRKGACNGCHNKVPPQKIVELRKFDKIHLCEFCGRILFYDESIANA
jgi:predicted  nucleic acid-binding Zn-ribbon protein